MLSLDDGPVERAFWMMFTALSDKMAPERISSCVRNTRRTQTKTGEFRVSNPLWPSYRLL